MLMRAKTRATTEARPAPMDFPEYRAEVEKLQRLRAEMEAVTRQHAALLETFPKGPDGIRMPTDLGRKATMALRAQDLLAGGTGGRDVVPDQMSQIDELFDRRELLRYAVEAQKHNVRQALRTVGREIAMQLQPEYTDVVRRLVDALAALKDASDAEREIVEHLMAHDIPLAFHCMAVTQRLVGYEGFMREAAEFYDLRPGD